MLYQLDLHVWVMFQLSGIVNCFVHVNKTPKFIPLSHLFVILPYLNSNHTFSFKITEMVKLPLTWMKEWQTRLLGLWKSKSLCTSFNKSFLQNNKSNNRHGFLVSKETVVLCRWERSKQNFFGFIKRVDKGWITTVKDLESNNEHALFVCDSYRWISKNPDQQCLGYWWRF